MIVPPQSRRAEVFKSPFRKRKIQEGLAGNRGDVPSFLSFLVFSGTGIILLLIPSLCLILEDFRRLFGLKEEHADHQLIAETDS